MNLKIFFKETRKTQNTHGMISFIWGLKICKLNYGSGMMVASKGKDWLKNGPENSWVVWWKCCIF